MFKKSLVSAFGIIAMLAAFNASAQSYVGATAGTARMDVDCAGTTTCDNSDTAFKVYGGFKVAPAIDVEISYFDLGATKATFGTDAVSLKATGADVAGVWRTSFNQDFGVFAKAGASYVRAESWASIGGATGTLTKNSFQPMVGVGLTYKITDVVRARADMDFRRVKFVDGQDGNGNVTSLSIGAEASF